MSRLTPQLEQKIRNRVEQVSEWGYEKELLAEIDSLRESESLAMRLLGGVTQERDRLREAAKFAVSAIENQAKLRGIVASLVVAGTTLKEALNAQAAFSTCSEHPQSYSTQCNECQKKSNG